MIILMIYGDLLFIPHFIRLLNKVFLGRFYKKNDSDDFLHGDFVLLKPFVEFCVLP